MLLLLVNSVSVDVIHSVGIDVVVGVAVVVVVGVLDASVGAVVYGVCVADVVDSVDVGLRYCCCYCC